MAEPELSTQPFLMPRLAGLTALALVPAAFVPGVGPIALLVGIPALLLVAAVVTGIARVLDSDIEALTRRTFTMTSRVTPTAPGASRFSPPEAPPELVTEPARALGRALDALLGRTSGRHVDSFLAAEKLDEARRTRSQFLANMSHELRSPMNSILGFSELLLRGMEGELAEEHRAPLHDIQHAGQKLLRTINEILDTAKCDAGKLILAPQAMVPAQIVRQAVQEVRRSRQLRSTIEIDTELQPGMEPVAVDPIHFPQALVHVIGHAADVLLEGRISIQVSDRQEHGRRVFVVAVELHGEVADKEREQLFVGFRKVGDGNIGLSMPLARRLVELHGGKLVVEDAGTASGKHGSLRVAVLVPEAPRPQKLGIIRTMRSLPAIEAVPRKARSEKSARVIAQSTDDGGQELREPTPLPVPIVKPPTDS